MQIQHERHLLQLSLSERGQDSYQHARERLGTTRRKDGCGTTPPATSPASPASRLNGSRRRHCHRRFQHQYCPPASTFIETSCIRFTKQQYLSLLFTLVAYPIPRSRHHQHLVVLSRSHIPTREGGHVIHGSGGSERRMQAMMLLLFLPLERVLVQVGRADRHGRGRPSRRSSVNENAGADLARRTLSSPLLPSLPFPRTSPCLPRPASSPSTSTSTPLLPSRPAPTAPNPPTASSLKLKLDMTIASQKPSSPTRVYAPPPPLTLTLTLAPPQRRLCPTQSKARASNIARRLSPTANSNSSGCVPY
ncbi:hypothetical protein GALMADRAFT_147432 [Galerina marginata CBS 339.88]|uniref:Uncharacterized protein n=1 Tax=Galerina marginata (strain CBS 339.88) TaxID=685588 RepID=A0A067S858_GALM3|nr:hypothetical protein GALMADRAFT_147432 [Galerina marginata CBS 339.88]